jgi:hypothetical protein
MYVSTNVVVTLVYDGLVSYRWLARRRPTSWLMRAKQVEARGRRGGGPRTRSRTRGVRYVRGRTDDGRPVCSLQSAAADLNSEPIQASEYPSMQLCMPPILTGLRCSFARAAHAPPPATLTDYSTLVSFASQIRALPHLDL